MKKKAFTLFFLLSSLISLYAQQEIITVSDNLVVEGIPALRASYIDEVKSYTEFRSATLADWNPVKKEMLISTRFGNSSQIHYVRFPGGDRKQITFFNEPVTSATFDPVNANYFLFLKDFGGDEFSQIFRFDMVNNKITLLTDGKRSQNGGVIWSNKGDMIAYSSTRRNGEDRDIFIMNPLDPGSDRMVVENHGGGWNVIDWSPDDKNLLLEEYISVNETRLYQVNVSTGRKNRLLPEKEEAATYSGICYSKDGNGIYLITNKSAEFNQLAYFNFSSGKLNYISESIMWDVENGDLSKDGSTLAFTTNENGQSKLYLLSTATNKFRLAQEIPSGLIGGIEWFSDSKSIGITFSNYNSLADVFEYNTVTGEFIRWTESELGGMDISGLREPQLISWKSFDGKTISGYLYKASGKFSGKRPVIISIHGGPEGQSFPSFLGRSNYYLNELGISLIYPNVRGSTGYGKTFVDLDNGMKREDSVKDIGMLLDWIAQNPDLDKDRIMVMGGSYGGYMTLAVSFMYSDRIRCSIDVVGISNFNTFMKNTEAYRRDLRRVEYGDERDPAMAAFFESTAPINHTGKIKKPLFIVQGGNDPRVPYTESMQMKEKILQNGGVVWFLMAKDEGHGFRKKNNVDFQFFSTIEFIKEYLLGNATGDF
jgi:dipeptidyl aminopeptidase/acylaminoacyl peptidase